MPKSSRKSLHRTRIWISCDLGVRGDYERWYAWLDRHKAKECVGSLAVLTYEYSRSLLDELKRDLTQTIEVTKRVRAYVIYRDAQSTKMKGTFLFGGRRVPPWTGYAGESEDVSDDES